MNTLVRILLAAVIVLSGVFSGSTGAYAGTASPAGAEHLFFYVLNSEGKSVLLKVLPFDDLKALQHGQLSAITSGEDTGRDYDISGIGISRDIRYCEAKGFTISELVDHVKEVSSVSGAEKTGYSGSDKIRLMATDSYGIYPCSWSYDNLYGVDRFFFEGLYDRDTGWEQGWETDPEFSVSAVNPETYYSQYGDTDPYYQDKQAVFAAGVPATAILAVESFSTGTGAESGKDLSGYVSDNDGRVSGCVSHMLCDNQSLRLLVPMSEADLLFSHTTASYNFDRIYNIRLDMADPPSVVSLGTVAAPQAALSIDDETMTITMSCATPEASMYYAFDGGPRNLYTGPVSVDVKGRDLSTSPVAFSMTAVKEGWDDAGVITVNCPDNPGITAVDEDGTLGYAADTLTVQVGYFGGPYYVKHVFTLDELKSMDVIHADYTFIDNMPSVVIDHVEGVRLTDLMIRAGIDPGSIQTFYFWTKDVTQTYFTTFPKTELIDTPRYCYYSLPDSFDYEEGMAGTDAGSDRQPVDTVIAFADDWKRCIAGAVFGSDYENLTINTRFRLVYGQKDTKTCTASRSAKWIHSIVVELGGSPVTTLDTPPVLDLEVGSVFHAEAGIKAVARDADIEWSSSNEAVASVDSNGTVTINAEGTAVITADYPGMTRSFTVNGITGGFTGETAITELVPSEGDAGGVQNWRVYEMSESATELPAVEEEKPVTFVVVTALCLFLGGVLCRIVKFKFDIDGSLNVFRNRFQ